MRCNAIILLLFLCSPGRPEPRGALRAGGHPQEEGCPLAGDPEAQGGITRGNFRGRGTGDHYRGQVDTFLCSNQLKVYDVIRIDVVWQDMQSVLRKASHFSAVKYSDSYHFYAFFSKTLQKSRHVAMGRKKFNMDPKKVNAFLDFCSCFCHMQLLLTDSFCRGFCFWWKTSCSDTQQRTLHSSCTREKASTRPQ